MGDFSWIKPGVILLYTGDDVGGRDHGYWVKKGDKCKVVIHSPTGKGAFLLEHKLSVSVQSLDPVREDYNSKHHWANGVWVDMEFVQPYGRYLEL